jgi:hypothetical protein
VITRCTEIMRDTVFTRPLGNCFIPLAGEPLVFVTYGEGAKEVTKRFTIGKKFATRQEAETAGLEFAKSWIDDGKPDLS